MNKHRRSRRTDLVWRSSPGGADNIFACPAWLYFPTSPHVTEFPYLRIGAQVSVPWEKDSAHPCVKRYCPDDSSRAPHMLFPFFPGIIPDRHCRSELPVCTD